MDHPQRHREAAPDRPRRRWTARVLIGLLATCGLLPLLLFVGLFATDTWGRWRFNAHSNEWKQSIAREIPAGTPKARVLAFFASRGVPLSCGDEADGSVSCGARERRDFGVMPVWSLWFEATFQQKRLVRVRQDARGIGF